MEQIEKKREKATKKKEPKIAEPTKPRHVDFSHASISHKNRKRQVEKNRDHSEYLSK